jgi:hypothetical protein
MKKIIATLALLATTTAPAMSAGWINDTSADDMTGKPLHIAFISADEKPSDFINHAVNGIGIRCQDNKLVVIGLTDGYVGNDSAKLDYVINNDGKVRTIRTGVSTDGTKYFLSGKAAINFAKTLATAQSFKINAYDFNGTAQFSSFNNNLSLDAPRSVLAKCGVKL